MRLKSIVLNGFKSFAERTVLSFEDGITGVVGPNGSGKSNISDAVRWVFGEQSVKTLRGNKMEDVIFAGTESRKSLGMAEVTLTLSNDDQRLPIAYAEVEITRRLYRSGESEYLLNGSVCRLKDIYELFLDTGLGRDGYSVIGQGKIDELLSSKPEDRRQVFEDAVGIMKYRYKKQESERKLSKATDNLLRLSDLLFELEQREEPLREQAESAKKFLTLRDELRVLDLSMTTETMDRLREQEKKLQIQTQDASLELEKLKAEIDALDHEMEQVVTETRAGNESADRIRRDLKALEDLKYQYENQCAVLKAQIDGDLRQVTEIQKESNTLLQQTTEFKLAQQQAEEKVVVAKSAYEQAECGRKEAREKLAHLEACETEADAALRRAQADRESMLQEETVRETRLQSLELLLKTLGERQKGLSQEQGERTQEQSASEKRLQDAQTEFETALRRTEETAVLVEAEKERLRNFSEQQRELLQQVQALTLQLSEVQTKHQTLSEMERTMEGYAYGVRQIIKAQKEGLLKGVLGPVSKLIRVPETLTVAIETALGGALQNVVTERENDAKEAIRYLKKNRLGRATFLPLDSMTPRELSEKNLEIHLGYLGVAADLVDCEPRLRPVVKSLLGRIVVVETLDDGLKMAAACHHRFQIVTREGEILHAGGALTGGTHRKELGILSRDVEIRALEQKEAALQQKKESKMLQSQELEQQILAVTESVREQETLLYTLREETARLKAGLEHLAEMAQHVRQAGDQLRQESTELESERLQLQQEYAQLDAGKRDGAARQIQMEEEMMTLRQRCEDCHAQLEEQRQVCMHAELLLNEASYAQERAEEALKLAAYQVMNHESDCREKEKMISELQEQAAQKENERQKLLADSETQLAQMAELQQELETLTAVATAREERLLAAQAGSKERRERLYLLQQDYSRLETRLSKTESELEHMTARLWEEYEITYTDAVAQRIPLESVSGAQKRINELRNQIRALGSIHVGAIEEYQELSERLTFLKTQKEDLEKAKEQLLKIIDEMTGLMRRQFTERFALINTEFGKIFTELFGGGRAAFQLSDENNVLESEIEVIVQPPGKKLQSIALLSGGEKALTAICMLFAILKIRPAPFTVMDEIDAALDEANVYRFSDYLKRLSEETQFIVVTHRRGTMESAGTLYGVTMPEKGVSKILPLKLNEIAQE